MPEVPSWTRAILREQLEGLATSSPHRSSCRANGLLRLSRPGLAGQPGYQPLGKHDHVLGGEIGLDIGRQQQRRVGRQLVVTRVPHQSERQPREHVEIESGIARRDRTPTQAHRRAGQPCGIAAHRGAQPRDGPLPVHLGVGSGRDEIGEGDFGWQPVGRDVVAR